MLSKWNARTAGTSLNLPNEKPTAQSGPLGEPLVHLDDFAIYELVAEMPRN